MTDIVGDETRMELCYRAVTMRNARRTFAEIATALNVSESTARNYVERGRREIASESMEETIARHRSIVADVQRANYVDAINPDSETRHESARTILRYLDHEARLTGAYAPARQEVDISADSFAAETLSLIAKLGSKQVDELAKQVRTEDRAEAVIDAEFFDAIETAAPGVPPNPFQGDRSHADVASSIGDCGAASNEPPGPAWSNIGG